MEDNLVNMDDDIFRFVRYKAVCRFKIKPVRVRHLNEMMNDHTLDIRHSSPGIPYEPGFKTTGEVFNSSVTRFRILEFWTKARRHANIYPPPCIVSYPTDCKNATADIHPELRYPALIAIGEAQFALPLIKGYLKDNKTPMAYALGMATEGPRCLRSQLCPNDYYGSCNFKNFEDSLKRDLIKAAFFVLRHSLDFGAYEGWEIPNAENMLNQYFYIMGYFLDTPVYNRETEELYVQSSHFPSGSHFTPLIDIVLYWMLVSLGYLKTVGDFPSSKQVFGEK